MTIFRGVASQGVILNLSYCDIKCISRDVRPARTTRNEYVIAAASTRLFSKLFPIRCFRSCFTKNLGKKIKDGTITQNNLFQAILPTTLVDAFR